MREVNDVIEQAQKLFDNMCQVEQAKFLEIIQELGSALAIAQTLEEALNIKERLSVEEREFCIRAEAARENFSKKVQRLYEIQAEYDRQVIELIPETVEIPEVVPSPEVVEISLVRPLPQLPVIEEVMAIRTVDDDLADKNTPTALVERLQEAIEEVHKVLPVFYRVTSLTADELFGLQDQLSKRRSGRYPKH